MHAGVKLLSVADGLCARWFPGANDLDAELRLAGLARIAIGSIFAGRLGLLALGLSHDVWFQRSFVAGVPVSCWLAAGGVVLSLLVAAGVLTPLSLLALIASAVALDQVLYVETLGTNVGVGCLIALFLASAGARCSVDAWLLRGEGRIGRVLGRFYGFWGWPTLESVRLGLGYGVASFGLLHFLALGHHLLDPNWVNGSTVGLIHINSYLCRFPAVPRALEASLPGLYWGISAAAGLAQTVWQASLLVLLASARTRWLGIVWGAAFVVGSFLFLRLSYLPLFELVLWAWLFGPRPRGGRSLPAGTRPVGPRRRLGVVCFALCAFGLAVVLALSAGHGLRRDRGLGGLVVHLGLEPPNVFNSGDLAMGDRWYCIERLATDGAPTLVPMNGPQGERGRYFWFDNLYFGTDLRWRRGAIGAVFRRYNAPGALGDLLVRRVCLFDWSWSGRPVGGARYRVSYYENAQSQRGSGQERYTTRLLSRRLISVRPPAHLR